MKLPLILGKICYILSYPLILLFLRGSRRVYMVIKVGDSLLVTKNWLGWHQKWHLPGGGAKKGESDLNALARELIEELGLDISAFKVSLLPDMPIKLSPGFMAVIYQIDLSALPELKVNSQEICAMELLPIIELQAAHRSAPLSAALAYLDKLA